LETSEKRERGFERVRVLRKKTKLEKESNFTLTKARLTGSVPFTYCFQALDGSNMEPLKENRRVGLRSSSYWFDA
jgi:hypothetical protein